ncbi:hypothetical protein CUJ86_01060 [Methanofollis fontis]|uniref:Uncharacterized protein n=2 Tax=Methanofollis fontis TaxID=2052832 RepID=A0A483CQG8_9EURY|nr:hypothetical protein CUJ86_01060 [Methanofollis fontis]
MPPLLLACVLLCICVVSPAAAGWAGSTGLNLPPIGGDNGNLSGNGSVFGSSGADPAPSLPAAPDPSDYDAMAAYLVEQARLSMSGSAAGAQDVMVTIYSVITDPDLADPDYLGREKVVKVDVILNSSRGTLGDTLWAYEVDATRIAETLFDGDQKGRTACVAVFFREKAGGDPLMKLVLDAKTAAVFDQSWDGTSYIRLKHWSDAAVSSRYRGVGFEDPSSAMVPGQEIVTTVAVPCDEEAFRNAVIDATADIAATASEMSIQSIDQDYGAVAASALALTTSARTYEEEFSAYDVPDSYEGLKDEFIAALDCYVDAGSAIWYGATFTDGAAIELGNEYLVEGQDALNGVLGGLNLRQVEDSTLTLQSTDLYPDALDLGEPYRFVDSREVNKISVRPRSYTSWGSYTLGTGEDAVEVRAPYGREYLFVLVEVNHIGYYGGGSSRYRTPKPTDFTLITGGDEYTPSQPSGYVRGVGSVYISDYVDKSDFSTGYLVFEVPESFDPEDTYLRAKITGIGTPIWKLSE